MSTTSLLCCETTCIGSASESEQRSSCVCWCTRPHMVSHHPTSLTCASKSPPCQHDDRCTRPPGRGDLLVPRVRVKFGNRAFAVAGPEVWNSLPVDIRSSETVTAFKSRLSHICINSRIARSNDSSDTPVVAHAMLWRLTN